MAEASPSSVPPPSPEHRRIAAGQFEHANQVVAARRGFHYAITLLLSCCRLDPANLLYRQALRRTQKARFNNNLRGSWLAGLLNWPTRARIKAALRARDYLRVLECGEQVLTRNPWDLGAQLDMAAAADALGLLDLAAWLLEQARQKHGLDPRLNRALALLYEKRGNFTQATALWEMVKKVDPADPDASSKVKDLAASETIMRGRYAAAAATGVRNGTAEDVVRSSETVKEPTPRTQSDAAQLRERLAADPTNAAIYLQLAALYRQADEFEQAHAVLRDGLGPTGNSFELAIEMADLEIEPFRRNLAVAEKKIATQPDDPELLHLRVRLRKEINTRELELHRKKAERFPNDRSHRLEIGRRLLRAGQVEEAIGELQSARQEPRLRCHASYYLGLCCKGRGNWPLAARHFDEALRSLTDGDGELRKELLYLLATASSHAGDLAKSVTLGRELLLEDRQYRDIARLLEEWQSRLQQVG